MRLWICTVFVDRWCSAAFGRPALLDLEGCHDSFFSPDSPPDPYLVALYRLSDLLHRATRAVDRDRLSTTTTDEQLETILSDFDAWTAQLPPSLQFAGPDSSRQGGWLHSLLVAFEVRLGLPLAHVPLPDLPPRRRRADRRPPQLLPPGSADAHHLHAEHLPPAIRLAQEQRARAPPLPPLARSLLRRRHALAARHRLDPVPRRRDPRLDHARTVLDPDG